MLENNRFMQLLDLGVDYDDILSLSHLMKFSLKC